MTKYRITCDPVNIFLAQRAAQYGEKRMPYKEALVCYGDSPCEINFYVKRTKTGFSITQLN
jgi:hypothetical protein